MGVVIVKRGVFFGQIGQDFDDDDVFNNVGKVSGMVGVAIAKQVEILIQGGAWAVIIILRLAQSKGEARIICCAKSVFTLFILIQRKDAGL